MQLFATPSSPYARITNVVRIELGLADRVDVVWTRTRQPDDPNLAFNPSGRIPFLRLEDGSGFEETDLIIEFLDGLSSPRRFARPDIDAVGEEAYWEFRREEVMARSMLDGVSVWGREIIRPFGEQSPGIIEHENRRAMRLAGVFEGLVAGDILSGPMNLPQLLLYSALNMNARIPAFDWRTGHPNLVSWFDRMQALPSVRESEPPPGA